MTFLQIPKPVTKIISLRGREWKISLYEEYLSHWNEEALSALEKILPKKQSADFRVQLTVKGVPFLVGVLVQRREIVVGSPRLAWELFLLERTRDLGELRKHLDKILHINIDQLPSVIEQVTERYRLPNFFENEELQTLCEKSQSLEEKLTKEIRRCRPTLFERLSDFFLKLIATYSLFRVHLLKFIAILPCLDHDTKGIEVKKVYLETLRRFLHDAKTTSLPSWLQMFFKCEYFFSKINPARFLARNIRMMIRFMAKRFIAGESIENAQKVFEVLRKTKRDATLDQLGELVVSEKEADHYCSQVLKLIRGLSLHVQKGEKNAAGIERAHISLKISALASDFKPEAPEYTYKLVQPRLKKILCDAKTHQVFINIDAEHYSVRDLVFYIYKRVLLETSELKSYQATGIVIQAYLRDAAGHFEEILALAKERGLTMPVRLVKGAYWDQETITADAAGTDAPQFLNKDETDIHCHQLIIKILEAAPDLQLCLGSHNLADHCFAETVRTEKFPHAPVIEHQCLHMTFEALSKAMAKLSWVVRNYVPIGSLLVGMAYLVRRILENSSQVGILMQMRTGGAEKKMAQQIWDKSITELSGDFFNTPPLRLYLPEEKRALDSAFERFTKTELGTNYSRSNFSGFLHNVTSPSHPEVMVGQIQYASLKDAGEAIEKAATAYNKGEWAGAEPIERASCLLKAAALMLLQRLELTALIVHEGGKNFHEAMGDVNEAIDFLNFYGREECRLNSENKNLVSRGVFGVISPWNFPLAIPCGMAAGALAAGNTVLLKPAEHTPLITQKLADILHAAGVPEDVFIYLPGKGSEVGKLVVEHPQVAGIVFTGSKQVGLWIAETAGRRIVQNKLFDFEAPAKIITEMGGKNAIIVTANAELDETVSGILVSAFGNAGQKCSAASRVLVDNRIKHRLTERLAQACRDLKVGPAEDYTSTVNPLITLKEKERLVKEASACTREAHLFSGKVVIDRSKENLPGCSMGPVVIDLPAKRSLAKESFAQKELFGPILHIIGTSNLNEAIQLFNSTEYGLTGGIFSQSQDEVEFLSKYLQSGNIYVNRPITGARVSVEPFGGFKMSGTGPKAGGVFYLEAFHHPLASKETATTEEFVLKYRGTIKEALPRFKEKYRWNRKVPGQLSFNDLSLVKKSGFYIANEEAPDIKTFPYFLGALAVGAKVKVLCLNEEAFKNWTEMARGKAEVMRSDATQLQKILREGEADFIIVEGDVAEIKTILNMERNFCPVLTGLNAPDAGDFEHYLEPFVHVRSFAVNVMRHGAPLEL